MKFSDFTTALTAVCVLQLSTARAKHGNSHLGAIERSHKHHKASHASEVEKGHGIESRGVDVEKRTGKCQFPSDAGLVAVTPNDSNGGWAMSPDQCCEPGNYCPYACPPGQVMAQWDPDATAYTYPQSMVRILLPEGDAVLTRLRTEDFTATKVEQSKSLFQTSHIVSMAPETLVARIRPRETSPFARPCFRATRPC